MERLTRCWQSMIKMKKQTYNTSNLHCVQCHLVRGNIEYGILKETGEEDDKTQEAMELLKSKGYKIVKK